MRHRHSYEVSEMKLLDRSMYNKAPQEQLVLTSVVDEMTSTCNSPRALRKIKLTCAWISRGSRLACLALLIFIITCQVDGVLSSVEKRLSPRIVTTKYGAVRGFTVNLAARSLQPVEVFLGKYSKNKQCM